MADAYEAWLQEQIAYYTNECLKSAAANGNPGNFRWADMTLRYVLETYEECLAHYERLRAPATLPLPDERD